MSESGVSSEPADTMRVASRFRGPPRSGNGGYTAGVFARLVAPPDAPLTVTLRLPPPLETPLHVMPRADDVWSLVDEAQHVVAEAAPGTFSRATVAPVGRDRAAAAHSAYRGLDDHSFDGCFVCGPGREPGDGLRLAPGVIGEGRTACVWTPDDSLADPARPGVAGREFVWAALDCPGGWTSDLVARPLVLGRMTATVVRQPQLGRPVVVVGELAETQGRKTLTSVSAYADDGTLVGRSEQTWIEVDPSVYST